MRKKIDLFRPYVPMETAEAVCDVLATRWIGQGPKVDEFEELFKKKFGLDNAIALNSCSSALELTIELIGLKEGDICLASPLSCTASHLPLIRKGIKIVWCDINEDTLCISEKDIFQKYDERVRAIMNVSLGGIKSDIGLWPCPVIHDGAQAVGTKSGDYNCYSFGAIKTISTPDMGVISCPTKEVAERARLLRWFGIDRRKKIANDWQCYKERQMTFDIHMAGYKYQPNDIAAAMAIVGLKNYDDIIAHNQHIFDIYKERLSGIDGIKIIDGPENKHWLMGLLVERRDDFARMLSDNGIESNLVHLRNEIYDIFGGKRADLPVLNSIEEKYIYIPIGPHVSIEDAEYISCCSKKGW